MSDFETHNRGDGEFFSSSEDDHGLNSNGRPSQAKPGSKKRPPWMDYFVAQFEDTIQCQGAAPVPVPVAREYRLEDVLGPEEPLAAAEEPPVAGETASADYPAVDQGRGSQDFENLFPPSDLEVPAAESSATALWPIVGSEQTPIYSVEPPGRSRHASPRRRLRTEVLAGAVAAMVLVAVITGLLLRLRTSGPAAETRGDRTHAAQLAPPKYQVTPADAQPKSPPVSAPESVPSGPPAEVESVQYAADSATVTIVATEKLNYQKNRLSNPERIFFDLPNTKLVSQLTGKLMTFNDPLLAKIRMAEHKSGTTRITLQTATYCDDSVTASTDPPGLSIKLRKASRPLKSVGKAWR